MPVTGTTLLPDEDQPALATTDDQIDVDRETQTTNNGQIRLQVREQGESTWDSNAAGWYEDTLTFDTLTTTVLNRAEDTTYELRLRSETPHVTGSWTATQTATTEFPNPQISVLETTTDAVTLEVDDRNDSEDGIRIYQRVEDDPLRETGYSSFEEIADLEGTSTQGTREYTASGLEANYDHQYYAESYRSSTGTTATSGTVTATTDVDIPSEGYFVVLEASDGDKATLPQSRLDGHPDLQPENAGVARWRVDIRPQPVLRDWKRSEVFIYNDGQLWLRGPFTRYHPEGGSGDAAAQLEGLGVLQYLNGGGLAFDVTNEPGYEAIQRFGDTELPDWIVDVTTPSSQTVDEDFTVQEESTGDGLEALLAGNGLEGTRWKRNGETLQVGQQSYTRIGLSRDRPGPTGFSSNESYPGAVDTTAVGIGNATHSLEYDEVATHDIPEEYVGFRIRFLPTTNPHPSEYAIAINGAETTLGELTDGLAVSGTDGSDAVWFDLVDEFGWTGGSIARGDDITYLVRGTIKDTSESFTANYGTAVSLGNDDLTTDRETVSDTDSNTEYVRGTDYEMDYVAGEITVLSDGAMIDGETYDIQYEYTKDGTQRFDVITVYDKRAEGDLNWAHVTNSEDQLPGPEYYSPATAAFEEFSQEFNVTAATVTATVSDTSGEQALQASNDSGTTWLPQDGSELNTETATADFAAAGTFGSTIQGHATLTGYGSDLTATPTDGRNPQALSSWELAIDTNALRVIDDQTYTGSPLSVLSDLAEDSGMTFIPDYREDSRALKAFTPGDVVEDPDWTIEDADPVDTTEGYYNQVTVYGPEDDQGERLEATATSQSEVDRVGEVKGPAKFRPDATTKEELVSIARTLLAEGISKDRVTGTLEISGQMVQPGIAYKVEEFAALDDETDPAYVLQNAEYSWGVMRLDFEGRETLAEAFRSIETEVSIAKRAV